MAGGIPSAAELDDLAEVALRAARSAGRLIVENRPDDLEVATKASITDLVTVMDTAAENALVSEIRSARPDDGLLGEEGSSRDSASGVTWILDPIDGTTNYVYGLADYAVSVAAVVGDTAREDSWRTVVGVVYAPAADETFVAAHGRGARLLTARAERGLRCAAPQSLATALVATGFGPTPQRREWQGQLVASILPKVRDVRRMGSAALDLCRVGQGTLDAYYETGLNPWDRAAGQLVASEAGARVAGLGENPTSALTWASAPTIADPFAAMVREGTKRHA